MAAKYIFTADDFGPIDFINKGVYYGVHKGVINSVHVLANGDKGLLVRSLEQLNDVVPDGETIDVGLHLTLTSGKPLHKAAGKSLGDTWGKMLKKGAFKPFNKFYFGYKHHFSTILAEFEKQHERLQESILKANAKNLKLTSLSHHHGIFAIDDAFFKKYAKFGEDKNLAIRNPRALPASANNSFFGFVVPLMNFTDSKADRKEMERMNNMFGQYRFAGPEPLQLKTPHYSEVGLYGKFGSLAVLKIANEKRIEKRVALFDEVEQRAENPDPIHGKKPKDTVVELVCHVGNPMQRPRGFKPMVKHYPGINHKYFEDRQHEVMALERIFNKNSELKNQLTGWANCPEIKFEAAG